ncbi:hypothetical protein [Pseudovibrio sp. Tun.PSC04-5.I4]|uniref:hypothetical protein n=1 Tax=Pseudovibrio sp. Tun.PSC04-5.I4 TaxID=1798213 RepID=UPI00088F9199|nr:hypothetical protein [Pseudovibrio sp. Tun.PSC04-5.I4]SDQ98169.1 hypothetical protein SAMN04515695_2164 [Pseudovibrio sp. Tun.PSC04-5.I4]
MEFAQQACKSLYLASNTGDNAGGFAFVVSQMSAERAVLPTHISLKDALTDQAYRGSFIYCPDTLNFESNQTEQQALVTGLHTYLKTMNVARGFMWLPKASTPLPQPPEDPNQRPAFFSINTAGTETTSSLSYVLVSELTIEFYSGAYIRVSDDQESLQISEGAIQLGGYLSPDTGSVSDGDIRCSGPDRGTIVFNADFERAALRDQWNWGFQWVAADPKLQDGVKGQRFALGSGNIGTREPLPMEVIVDVTDPLNLYPTHNSENPERCAFYFRSLEQNGIGPTVNSFYRTTYGAPISLTAVSKGSTLADARPAALVLSPSFGSSAAQQRFIASPIGDFLICAPARQGEQQARFMCGLGGTEFLQLLDVSQKNITSAARLRFIQRQPAFAPVFPLPRSSPTGPPAPKGAPLKSTYQTSYVQVIQPQSSEGETTTLPCSYVAQPRGSALHGYDDDIWQENKSLLGTVSPSYTLPAMGQDSFPLFPYSGKDEQTASYSQNEIALFEKSIIAPIRRQTIAKLTNSQITDRATENARDNTSAEKTTSGQGSTTLTTPSGVIATLASPEDARSWQAVKLAQIKTPESSEFSFIDPSAKLIEAFQTNQLFMVAANGDELGQAGKTFLNTLNIEEWQIEADVGNSPDFGDYANILIIKGIRGPLYDPKGDEKDNLIANPQKWTQKETFSAPTTVQESTPDQTQLLNVSTWLQDYFQAAVDNPDGEYLANFNQVAADPNWTGVLMLRARIKSPPEQLAGIVAGVRDQSLFYAHHLAIRINQIKADQSGGEISIKKQSSVYGLIYYEDPEFIAPKGKDSPQPVVPSIARTYDFILLSLKVLFENTAIKKFSSYAQLAIDKVFDSAVINAEPISPSGQALPSGSQYNSLIMTASYQDNNHHPSYTMAAPEPYVFTVENNVLQQVEFSSAQMNTITSGAKSKQEEGAEQRPLIRFGLAGFLSFAVLKDSNGQDIDLFSFGGEAGQTSTRIGLNFANLGLEMTFSKDDPYETQKIVWDSAQMSFNMSSSTLRPGSLLATMPLELQSYMSSATAREAPSSLGFLNVITNVRQQGVSEAWNGLKFKVNLGTAGDLAGKLGLNAYVLLAWSPDSKGNIYKSMTGIQMPGTTNGASLISLQNVLSMSYGPIQLLYADKPTTKSPSSAEQITSVSPQSIRAVEANEPSPTSDKQYMFVLNEIAIKFMGLAKIPPNGATSFYLFAESDTQAQSADNRTGLAWYAAYNNEPEDS